MTTIRLPRDARGVLFSLVIVLAGAGAGHAASSADQFQSGREDFERGRYGQAATDLKAFLDASPGSSDAEAATWMLAESYRQTSQWALAEVEYQHLLSTFPGSARTADASFNMGVVLWKQAGSAAYDQEMTARAMAQFMRFLQLNPGHARAAEAQGYVDGARMRLAEKLYRIARLYLRMRLHASARLYVDELVSTYPETMWADRGLILRAQSLEKEGKLGESLEVYTHASRSAHDAVAQKDAAKGLARLQKRLGTSSAARTP
jgi:outer membrane assembly lipoprotein YfiO